MDAVITLPDEAKSLIQDFVANNELEAEVIGGAGIDGGGDLGTVVVSVTASSLTALVAILKAKWDLAKSVTIEVDGMKVTGVDPDKVEKILRQLLNAKMIGKN